MNIGGSIALDVMSVIYIVTILFNLGRRHAKESYLKSRFLLLVVMIAVMLITDILYLSVLQNPDYACRMLAKFFKNIYFIVNSAVVWLWATYVNDNIFDGIAQKRVSSLIYFAVFMANSLLVIVNMFTDVLFKITPDGQFGVQLIGMLIFTILNYLVVIMAFFTLIKYRKSLKKTVFIPLLIFPLLPLLAEIFVLFYRPFSLISLYAVSVMIIFQTSQNASIYTDELTGLSNRRMLNEYLTKLLTEPKGVYVCGIMIDMDGLKNINDTYGHVEGDRALINLAELIKTIDKSGMVSVRYGGDEFVLVWTSPQETAAQDFAKELEHKKSGYNADKSQRDKLHFSTGAFSCFDKDGLTVNDFLRRADEEMYRVKIQKRQTR